MKRLLLLSWFIFSILRLSGQSKADSLQLALHKTSVDSVKIQIYHRLSKEYQLTSPTKAEQAIKAAIGLSTRSKNDRLLVDGYTRYAEFYYGQNKPDSAIVLYEKVLQLARKINFFEGQSTALVGIGNSYWTKGNFQKAREFQEFNLELATKTGNEDGIAGSYIAIGNIHSQTGEYTKAMEYYTMASEKYQELGNLRSYARALGNIGYVQRSLENYESAEKYFIDIDSIYGELKDLDGKSFAAYNLSVVYKNTGQLEKAIAYNLKGLEGYEQLGNKKRVSYCYYTMGEIYKKKENIQQALDSYRKSLDISTSVDDSVQIGYSSVAVAECYRLINQSGDAKQYLQRAMDVAKGINLDILAMDVHENLSQIYAAEGGYLEAYENLNRYAAIRDSLYTEEKRELGSDIEAKYQNEQKLKEIALLSSEKNLQALQLQKRVNERNGIIALALIVMIIAGLLYTQYRTKQQANRKLQELDRLKSNFFANISHEFRTPLTLIKGPIEQLEQNPGEQLDRATVKMIRRNATRVLQLVNQLLELSKIDEGNLKLEPTEGDVFKCLRAAAASFNSHAAQRHIDYKVQIPQAVLWASFDRDKLEKVVYNLLSNAFKFSDDGAVISFEVVHDKGHLQLQIADSGRGIPERDLPFIFDRFFQVDSNATREQEGSGIGLSLSKDLVELMDGTITATSEIDKGSFFVVHLPVQEIKTGETASPVVKPTAPAQFKPDTFELTKEDKRDLPHILLVEDNEDMRYFIKEQLIKFYKVKEAVNGEAGLKKAIANPPELIITDLMMPSMDGMELCKKLKTEVHTSHIPVIMLTAKAGMENKIEGLETGADDYLTKPFNGKELLARVMNLIEQRQKLRSLFSNKGVQIDPKKVTVTSVDQKFLEQVLALLEVHYSESDFGVPQMQKALAMSKTQLHRKLKALTNEAPGELLRNFRLKRAAHFLSQKADSVTQIAYKVGFNNLSYFAKCFKELYGTAPSAY